jgi:hypothetical protein
MPTALLIAEQERLKLLFAGMQSTGMFRLRVAPTLAQAEEEIAARLPHFVFVENYLSGQGGSDMVSYLRGLLPQGTEVILLARDAADADDFREAGGLFSLDLSASDESLQSAIADLIPLGTPATPETPPSTEPLAPPKAARELLFRGQEDSKAKPKRAIWLSLALGGIALCVIAYQTGKKPPHEPSQQAATGALKDVGGRVEPAAATAPVAPAAAPATATPAAPKRTVSRAADRPTAASGAPSAAPQTLSSYVVQPNDKLLRVLVRHFGFSYPEALGMAPELRRLNNLKDLNLINPGQVILIPAAPKPDKQQ